MSIRKLMNITTRRIGIVMIVFCGLLAACSGTPTDEALPTLAQLPTTAPSATVTSVQPSSTNTAIEPKSTANTLPPTATQAASTVVPSTAIPSETSTPSSNGELGNFPKTLEVGQTLSLQGTLTTKDPKSGVAILTSEQGQTVNLLVDEFTALTANNQVVQITGQVEASSNGSGNAIRVSEIRMVNGSSALATATDAQANLALSAVPTTSP